MANPRRVTATVVLALCSGLIVAACNDDLSPEPPGTARLSIAPVLQTQSAAPFEWSQIRIRLLRSDGTTVVRDTTIDLVPGQETVEITLTVELHANQETFYLEIFLIDTAGDTILRGGPAEVTATANSDNAVSEITLRAAGPDSSASDLTIVPLGGPVLLGQIVTLTAIVTDDSEGVIQGANIVWQSLDPARLVITDIRGGVAQGGSEPGPARVVASLANGLSDTATVDVTSNTLPTVTIEGPATGSSFADQWSIFISATATDAEDGDLSSTIAWSSDVDGPLGTGATLALDLSPDTHLITGSVTDSDGGIGAATASYTVVTPGRIPLTGTETVFNFDLTTLTNDFPLSNITWGATFDAADPVIVGDVMTTRVYGGPDATGLVQIRDDTDILTDGGTTYGPLTTANPIYDPMLDGIFSFSLQMTSGTATLTTFTACGNQVGLYAACIAFPLLPGAAPTVSIVEPANNATLFSGQPVTFTGTAADTEDGDLSADITWTSNLDGTLGTGASITATLSLGTHTITASVTDSDLWTTTTAITVNVVAGTFTNRWINSGGGDWSDPANWSLSRVPLAEDTVVFDAAGTYTVTLQESATIEHLIVGDGTNAPTLTIQGTSGVSPLLTVNDGVVNSATVSLSSTVADQRGHLFVTGNLVNNAGATLGQTGLGSPGSIQATGTISSPGSIGVGADLFIGAPTIDLSSSLISIAGFLSLNGTVTLSQATAITATAGTFEVIGEVQTPDGFTIGAGVTGILVGTGVTGEGSILVLGTLITQVATIEPAMDVSGVLTITGATSLSGVSISSTGTVEMQSFGTLTTITFAGAVTNAGEMRLLPPPTVDETLIAAFNGGLDNSGNLVRFETGGLGATILQGSLTNTGAILIPAGVLEFGGTDVLITNALDAIIFVTAGATDAGIRFSGTGNSVYNNEGGIALANPTDILDVVSGTLNNLLEGTIIGNPSVFVDPAAALNSSGSVEPGTHDLLAPGTPGLLSVNGDLTLASGGRVVIDVEGATQAGVDYDQLTVSGTLTLEGSLDLNLVNYTPVVGDQFVIATFGSSVGDFATFNLPALGTGEVWSITNTGTSYVLEVVPG